MVSEQPVSLRLRRQLLDITQPPKPLHQVAYTRVGNDIVLEVGHFDLPEVREVLERARTEGTSGGEVSFYVTDRFFISPDGAVALYAAMKQLVEDLQNNGLIPPGNPTEGVH